MGWFDDIFGAKQTQQNQQQGTSTTSTQSNALGQINPLFQQYLTQFQGASGANVPISPYQTSAADNQMGTTSNLLPAYSAATGVAQTGINPWAINSFMSPYVQNVVDTTRADFNAQNARDLSNTAGQAAKLGALTGSQGAGALNLARESQRRTQDPIIAGLYNQGYGQAAGLAAQSAGLQLQGAGTLGSLTGAQTAANTGLSGIGNSIWQNQYQNTMLPYQLNLMGSQGLSPYLGAYGQTSTQNTSGTSSGTGTNSPSPFQVGTNLFGGYNALGGVSGILGLLSDERVKEDIRPVGKTDDGMPIYTYRYKGSPVTQMGLLAQDVEHEKPDAVGERPDGLKTVDYDKATRAHGGRVGGHNHHDKPFHEKVVDAFHAVDKIRKLARGGSVMPGYADGGDVPYGDWNSPAPNGTETMPTNWTPVVEREPQGPSAFQSWLDKNNAPAARPQGDFGLGRSADRLNSMLTSMRPGFATRGGVWEPGAEIPTFGGDDSVMPSYAGAPRRDVGEAWPMSQWPRYTPPRVAEFDRETPEAPEDHRPTPNKSWFSGWGDMFKPRAPEGVMAGDAMTPGQRAAVILSGMGNMNVGASVMDLQKARMAELEAERAAGALLGKYKGAPTMQMRELNQARDLALGNVPGYGPTLAARAQSETERMNDKPTWGITHHDQYGTPQYGLIDVSKAMPPRTPPGAPRPAAAAPVTPPPTRVAGGPEDRDPSAPMGSPKNPVFVRDPAEAPDGSYYTTPDKLWPPTLKGAPPAATPPAAAAPVTPPTGLPPGVVTPSALAPNRGSPELTGEEFLATLDPVDRIKVKHIAEGLEPFPTGMGAQKGRGAFLAQAVTQYDPTFDVRNYAMRQKTLNSFKSGPIGEQVKALNTVAGHLDDMLKASTKMNNFRYVPAINAPYNAIRGQLSTDYQRASAGFEANASAVAGEMAKVFRASGMSRADFEDWSKLLKHNASPETIKGAVEKAVHLIDSRMDALKNQWYQGMGDKVPFTAIEPKAQAIFDRLRGGGNDWSDKGAAPVKITNDADYAKLPSGARYIDPTGKERTKR